MPRRGRVVGNFCTRLLQRDPVPRENGRGTCVGFTQEAEQQMLRANLIVDPRHVCEQRGM